jgi:hypothetical protein
MTTMYMTTITTTDLLMKTVQNPTRLPAHVEAGTDREAAHA